MPGLIVVFWLSLKFPVPSPAGWHPYAGPGILGRVAGVMGAALCAILDDDLPLGCWVNGGIDLLELYVSGRCLGLSVKGVGRANAGSRNSPRRLTAWCH